MKVVVEMGNLSQIVEDSLKNNVQEAVNQALKDIVREKVDGVLKDSLSDAINSQIDAYVREYLESATVTIGNSFEDDDVRTVSVQQYLKEKVKNIFDKQIIQLPSKNRWGERTGSASPVSFKDYVDNVVNVDAVVKTEVDKMAASVKCEVNTKIKNTFDNAMRSALADNVFAIVTSTETYKTISQNLKLLGE